MTDCEPMWPVVFETGDISQRPDKALLGDALCGWAICMSGTNPCPRFGDVMAAISLKLGVSGTPESFMELSKSGRFNNESQ